MNRYSSAVCVRTGYLFYITEKPPSNDEGQLKGLQEEHFQNEEGTEQVNEWMNRFFVHRFENRIQDETEGNPAFDATRERHDENCHERREVLAEIGPIDIADICQHQGTDDDEGRSCDGRDTRDRTDERTEK